MDCSGWSCSGRGTAVLYTNASDTIMAWTTREVTMAARGQRCFCRCDSGWRSTGDLYGAHCRTHSVTVYVLWMLTAIVCGLLLVVCLRFLYAYWRHNRSLRLPPKIVPLAASFLPQKQPSLIPAPAAATAGVAATAAPIPTLGQPQPHLFLHQVPQQPQPQQPQPPQQLNGAVMGEEASLISAAPFNSRGAAYVPRPGDAVVAPQLQLNDDTTGDGSVAPVPVTLHVRPLPTSAISTMSSHGTGTNGTPLASAPLPLSSQPLPPPVAVGGTTRVHGFTVRPSVTGDQGTLAAAATGQAANSNGNGNNGRRGTVMPPPVIPIHNFTPPPRLLSLPQVQYVLLCLSMTAFYFATAVVKLLSIDEPLSIAYDVLPTLLYGLGACLISWAIFIHAWRILVVAESISADQSLTAYLSGMKRGLHIALFINCLSYAVLLVPIYYHGDYNNDVNAYWTDDVQEKCVVAHLMVKTFSLFLSGPLIHEYYAKKLLRLLHETSSVVGRRGGTQSSSGGHHAAGGSPPSTPLATQLKSPIGNNNNTLTSPGSQHRIVFAAAQQSPPGSGMDTDNKQQVSTGGTPLPKPTAAQMARTQLAESINRLKKQATRLSVTQMLVMIVIAYWPYARALGAYLMPLIMVNGGWVILLSVLVLPKPTVVAPRVITESDHHQQQQQGMEASKRIVRLHTMNDTAGTGGNNNNANKDHSIIGSGVDVPTPMVGWPPSVMDNINHPAQSLIAAGSSVRVRITPPQVQNFSRSEMVEESVAVNHDVARGGGARTPVSHWIHTHGGHGHEYEPSSIIPLGSHGRGTDTQTHTNTFVAIAGRDGATDSGHEPLLERVDSPLEHNTHTGGGNGSDDHEGHNSDASVHSSPPSQRAARGTPSSRASHGHMMVRRSDSGSPHHTHTYPNDQHHTNSGHDGNGHGHGNASIVGVDASLPFTVAMVPLVDSSSSTPQLPAPTLGSSSVPATTAATAAIRARLSVGRVSSTDHHSRT